MIGQGCDRNGEGRYGCGNKGCHKCYGEEPNAKATSPAAGPASSAVEAKSEGGTGQGPATIKVGLCSSHDKTMHIEIPSCVAWFAVEEHMAGVRTGLHPESANSKQVGGEHYKIPVQTWDFIVANGIGFLEGNAIKYIVRHKSKGGRQDLEKAIHYLQKALEVYYSKDPT